MKSFELSSKKIMVPLTKEQIVVLPGGAKQKRPNGQLRGEKLFVRIHREAEHEYESFEVLVKNNNRSQDRVLPEGYLLLKSETFPAAKKFRYDIASGRITIPVFTSWTPGKISVEWRSFPALLFYALMPMKLFG